VYFDHLRVPTDYRRGSGKRPLEKGQKSRKNRPNNSCGPGAEAFKIAVMSRQWKKNRLPDWKDQRSAGLEKQLAQPPALIQKLQQQVHQSSADHDNPGDSPHLPHFVYVNELEPTCEQAEHGPRRRACGADCHPGRRPALLSSAFHSNPALRVQLQRCGGSCTGRPGFAAPAGQGRLPPLTGTN